MSLPYMPLYIPDYLADTTHLDALESGAYLHLIMHYWMNGGLPDDDRSLARIAKTTEKQWKAIRPTIEAFFLPDWRHGRIDREYEEALRKQEKRARAGRAGNRARWGSPRDKNAIASASQSDRNRIANGSQPEPEPEPKIDDRGSRARDPGVDLLAEISGACGFKDAVDWPPGWKDAYRRVQSWREQWPDDLIVLSVQAQMLTKRDGPPSSVNYFEKGIARMAAQRAAPLPTVQFVEPAPEIVHVQRRPDLIGEAADRIIDQIRSLEGAERDEGARGPSDRGVVEIFPPRKTG
jgi:uncharacterized protein YdaU (DUF1376 family)